MSPRRLLGFSLITVVVSAGSIAAQAPRVVALTANDQMKYSLAQIVAKPGETLKIKLTSTGTIPKEVRPDNFVLLKPTANVDAFVMAATMARDTGYIPAAQKTNIIANTTLAGPGETVEVTFAAPKVPGTYKFICSFAGHFQAGMTGVLIVK